MKKSFMVMFAFLLAAVLFGTVCAQTETVTEIKWEDVSSSVEEAGISGDFYAVGESGLYMWVPDVLEDTELTDEDIEDGYIAYLMPEDESAVVAVMSAPLEGITVDGYYELLTETEGVEEVEYVVVNGIAAVSYEMPEQDSMTLAFVDDEDTVYEFTFSPMSDEGFAMVTYFMAASIQTVE